VSVDDLLVVVESDKASMEIPSTHAGKILEVHVSEGSQVEAGTLLVTLESATDENAGDDDKAGGDDAKTAGDDAKTAGDDDKAAGKPPEEAAEKSGDNKSSKKDAASTEQAPKAADRAPGETSTGADVYAGPAVRRLARELGVDLGGVSGSGNRGRIVKDDVKAYVKERMRGGAAAAPAAGAGIPPIPAVDFSKFGEVEEQPLSRIRARGAENLHRSWLNLPHVTQHDEVDVTDLEQFRGTLKAEGERRGVKVTPLAFIIRACCQTLKEFPTFNASLDPSARTFILKRYYNIGMAVDTPEGLVVPVIHDADRKGVWELSAEIVELAQKARDKKLGMNDAQGGSFSVSSLGAIGGTGFTPIINAPEVAILGIGRMTMRPVWRGEAFVPRQMLPLSLSYDHRAINGAEGGRFVSRLGELLSDIRRLAL
jgi:pyruvate dehydrogenase E2 component (dihydrolipoamide acetyltransferase)